MEKLQRILNQNKRNYHLEFLIPVIPLISKYYLPGTSTPISFVVVTALMLYCFLRRKNITFTLYKPLLFLFIYMAVHDIIKSTTYEVNISQWVIYILISVFLFFSANKIDERRLIKFWCILAILITIGMLYDVIQIYVLKKSVSTVNLFGFLFKSEEEVRVLDRPTFIFSEPSAYSTWITPFVYLLLINEMLPFAIILSVVVLATGSAVGIMMTILLWTYYLFKNTNKSKAYRRIIVVFIAILVVFAVMNLGIFSSSIGRIEQMVIETNYRGGSTYRRLFAGYDMYFRLPFYQKLFGIPYNDISSYMLSGETDLTLYYTSENAYDFGYVNGISRCLIMYGFFGFVLYLYLFYSLYKKSERRYKGLVLLVFASAFGQSTYFNTGFLFQLSLIFGLAGFIPGKHLCFCFRAQSFSGVSETAMGGIK